MDSIFGFFMIVMFSPYIHTSDTYIHTYLMARQDVATFSRGRGKGGGDLGGRQEIRFQVLLGAFPIHTLICQAFYLICRPRARSDKV